jgi:NADH dehydrogenase
MSTHRIVIVGGGFGGVKAALELADDPRFHVTLISDNPEFGHHPTLYRTATGGRNLISSYPLSGIFADKPVKLITDTATSLDRTTRSIMLQTGEQVPYDGLILALGVGTNFFHIKGLEEFAYGIKSLSDATKFKHHLHQQLIDDKQLDLNYVIVGGGPTGVELAGVLPSYLRDIAIKHHIPRQSIHVDLVEASPRLLPRMSKQTSRRVAAHLRSLGIKVYTKSAVQAQTADGLMVNNKPIRSHTVVWTAGVTNSPFFGAQGFQLAKNGKVRVDQFLQAEPGIYVIGDNADTPYSGMAQTALYDGHFVANNLRRLADQKDPRPYVAKKPAYVMPAGPKWAAVEWGPFRAYGRLGWWLRRAADFVAYSDYEPWQQATKRWMAEDDTQESCPYCVDDLARLEYASGEA